MDDNGTYLGNIYGIYKESITNISIDIYDIQKSDTQAPPPSAAAPSGLCLITLYHKYLWIYLLYIPHIFHIYFLDMFHCHPCIFPCVFLNLWSQEKISPYHKTTFLLLKFQVLRLLYFY